MIPRRKETNVCADCKPDACIVDVGDGPDRTINCQRAGEGSEVGEMFLVRLSDGDKTLLQASVQNWKVLLKRNYDIQLFRAKQIA